MFIREILDVRWCVRMFWLCLLCSVSMMLWVIGSVLVLVVVRFLVVSGLFFDSSFCSDWSFLL